MGKKGEFQQRLEKHHDELRWLYMELYDNSSMFAELCERMQQFDKERNKGFETGGGPGVVQTQ